VSLKIKQAITGEYLGGGPAISSYYNINANSGEFTGYAYKDINK